MQYEREFLEVYFHNILNGFSPFVLDGELFLAKHLTSKEIFEANSFITLRASQLKMDGLATDYEILKKSSERGIWDQNNEQKVVSLQKQIKIKTDTIQKLAFPSQAKPIEAEIKQIKEQIQDIKEERQKLLFHSLECKILMEKRDYLIYLGVYTPERVKYWNSYDIYLENEVETVDKMGDTYYKTINELSSNIIRAVARETDARFRLKAFLMPELTSVAMSMIELKQWCDFYNSIYELPDRPNEDIISDDIKLDGWILSRRLKNESQNSVKSDGGTSFTGMVAEASDMEFLGGTKTGAVLNIAKQGK